MTERPAVPTAKKIPTERTHHGDVVVDEYEWLREKDDPEVIAIYLGRAKEVARC